MLQAALWDNAELLEDLLDADQLLRHIDCVDAWGRTPLHAAATSEDSSCLRILLQSGGLKIPFLYFIFLSSVTNCLEFFSKPQHSVWSTWGV